MVKQYIRNILAAASVALLGVGAASSAQAEDLLYLSYNVPNSLNVDGPGGTFPPSYGGMSNVLEPLVYFELGESNADGLAALDVQKFVGRLAESWDFDVASLTWTLNLRRGVKGCNGATFDADDLLYTLARAKSISGTAPIGYFLANVGSVDKFDPSLFGARSAAKKAKEEGKPAPSPDKRQLGDEVTKIDQYTVKIRQSQANGLFLPVFAIFALLIYDKETMEANATEDDPWSHDYANTVNGPSFGPWCVAEWKKEDTIILEANKDYYRGAPYYDRVIWKKIPESSTRLTVLRTGQADFVDSLSPREFSSLEGLDGIKVGGTYLNSTVMMSLNWDRPPFDNVKVRKAIAYAIPYDQLIEKVYYGSARKWDGLVPPGYPGYFKPSISYNYNPEKAKQLLAEAGFPGGKGLEKFSDEFKLAFVAERESIIGPVATIIQSSLKAVGFPVLLDPLPLQSYSDRQFVKKDLGMALNDTSRPIGIDASYAVMLQYVTVAKGGLNNWGNYSNARVDELFFKVKGEADQVKRNAMLKEIQETIMDELALVPVLEYKHQYAWREGVSGVAVHAEAQPRFYDLRK
jgi:peptide/nickel transport system substrate-binding protein